MDYGQTKPMERDTICRIYSMTKPVTAVAVHILIERGLLEYHAPLKEYLPEFSHMMVQDVYKRQLLGLWENKINIEEQKAAPRESGA